jgi:hypothetical protein
VIFFTMDLQVIRKVHHSHQIDSKLVLPYWPT